MGLEFFTPDVLPASLGQEIAAFLDSQNTGHPFQFPEWAGTATRFALLREAGQIRWFASYSTQRPLGSRFPWFRALKLNRGPVCDNPELWRSALDELLRHARETGFVYLEAMPDRPREHPSDPAPEFGREWKPVGGDRVSLRLDLTRTEEELLAGLRKNTRYEVRRAERIEVSVEPTTATSDVEEFLALYARTADRKGFAADSPDYVRGIVHWLMREPTRGALLLARDQTSVSGGAVIVRSGNRCWYVWGASDKRDQFSAGHSVQWRAILWAKARGCTEYDFGGYTAGATSGPAFFKEGFGGEMVHFVPAHRKVIRRGRYRVFEILSKLRKRTVAPA